MTDRPAAVVALCALAALLLAIGLPLGWKPSGGQAQSSIASLGIDMDAAGNGPRTRVGVDTSREVCNRVDQSQTLQIDVFVDEIPADRGVASFQVDMLFSSNLVTVTATDRYQLLNEARHSDVFPLGDTISSDGSYSTGAVDFGPVGIEPDGTSEIGPGILVRITLTGQAGVGVADLTLQYVLVQGDDNLDIPVGTISNAKVAVNTDCPPADTDGDTFNDSLELYLGTDPLDACPDDPSDAAWPFDIDNDATVTVTGDIFNYRGRLGTTPGSAQWWQRLDLNQSGDISVTGDIFMYRGKLGATCT